MEEIGGQIYELDLIVTFRRSYNKSSPEEETAIVSNIYLWNRWTKQTKIIR